MEKCYMPIRMACEDAGIDLEEVWKKHNDTGERSICGL